MKIIGLCGGSGSGKSSISACLAETGAEIIDADQIARSLTAPGSPILETIRLTFGNNVFTQEGTLNRRALANIVFSNPEELHKLNQITHPEIAKQTKERLKHCKNNAVIDAAVLHHAGLEQLCDMTVFVTAPMEIRIQRIMARDGISAQEAQNRIQSQPSDEEYRSVTDMTVCNDGSKTIHEIADYILQGVMSL